jgi:hypothetical protein
VRELYFNDIVLAAIDRRESSQSVIDLVKMMKSEAIAGALGRGEFDYRALYRIFVHRRKIKLLRYLFSLHNDFGFTPALFIEALELEAYDIAALLYKEFFRSLRGDWQTR